MQEYDFKRYQLFDACIAPIGDEHLEQMIGKLLFWIRTLAGEKDVEPETCIPYHHTRHPRRRRQSTDAMKRAFRNARDSAANDDG
jgi:hypothetical protein